MRVDNLTIEILPNGFVRVEDSRCNWAMLYNLDGTHRSGGVDTAESRRAVRGFLILKGVL